MPFAERFYKQFDLDRAFKKPLSRVEERDTILRPDAVSRDVEEPYSPDLRDLARLYWLARSREVVTVTEFGSGFSTGVLALALEDNEAENSEWATKYRRSQDPFKVIVLEESSTWADVTLSRVAPSLLRHIEMNVCQVSINKWNGRYCSFFNHERLMPADLYVVDGPSQFSSLNAPDGWNTDDPVLMPMAADMLPIEHFFEPGAVILFDGRSANARFVSTNLQRNWAEYYHSESDVTVFELQEAPLGDLNRARIEKLQDWLIPCRRTGQK